MNRYVLIGSLILFNVSTGSSQVTRIGQQVPEVVIKQILNYHSPQAKLSEFGGKPIILDFWATWCVACLQAFPKTDSLQKVYKDRLQFLLVTRESKEVTEKLFTRDRFRHIKLPLVVADAALSQIFPYRGLPHLVWIDANGIVKAITDYSYVTTKNLDLLLAEKNIEVPTKSDVLDVNVANTITPFMYNDYENTKDKVLQYSYLGDFRPGISSRSSQPRYDPLKGTARTYINNGSIDELYRMAYRYEGPQFHNARIIHSYLPTDRFATEPKSSKNRFCYERIIRDTSVTHLTMAMQKDLDTFFNINSSKEMRFVKCLILKRTSAADKLKSKGGTVEYYRDKNLMKAKNVPFYLFSQRITAFSLNGISKIPVIDETGYIGKVDIEYPSDISDLKLVNQTLSMYDLVLEEAEREMEVVVLQD